MSDHQHRRPAEGESHVSADRGALLATLVHLWPYIWPSDRRDLKQRVIWSLALLLAAKLATIAVPFFALVSAGVRVVAFEQLGSSLESAYLAMTEERR
jgi:hypothetical protein